MARTPMAIVAQCTRPAQRPRAALPAGAARVRQCVTRVASAAGGPAAQPSPAIAISPAPEERQRRALPPGRFLAPGISGLRFRARDIRSEEHTSELQSLMRISYAVFLLKKKTHQTINKSLL